MISQRTACIKFEPEVHTPGNVFDAVLFAHCFHACLHDRQSYAAAAVLSGPGFINFYLGAAFYADVLLDRDFSAMTRAEDESVHHEAGYLSAGTLDIMYLAVRLAVCELALPEGESCPLILDDALVNLDDERLEQAMKLLGEIAKQRQVILFTCRK